MNWFRRRARAQQPTAPIVNIAELRAERHGERLDEHDAQIRLLTERLAGVEGFQAGLQAATATGRHTAAAAPTAEQLLVRDMIMQGRTPAEDGG